MPPTVATAAADASGNFSASFAVPGDAVPGQVYYVYAVNSGLELDCPVAGCQYVSASFAVTSAPQLPDLVISNVSIDQGGSVYCDPGDNGTTLKFNATYQNIGTGNATGTYQMQWDISNGVSGTTSGFLALDPGQASTDSISSTFANAGDYTLTVTINPSVSNPGGEANSSNNSMTFSFNVADCNTPPSGGGSQLSLFPSVDIGQNSGRSGTVSSTSFKGSGWSKGTSVHICFVSCGTGHLDTHVNVLDDGTFFTTENIDLHGVDPGEYTLIFDDGTPFGKITRSYTVSGDPNTVMVTGALSCDLYACDSLRLNGNGYDQTIHQSGGIAALVGLQFTFNTVPKNKTYTLTATASSEGNYTCTYTVNTNTNDPKIDISGQLGISQCFTVQKGVSDIYQYFFNGIWQEYDQSIANGTANSSSVSTVAFNPTAVAEFLGVPYQTWTYGPAPITGTLTERYEEGSGHLADQNFRWVQYFDKARMEITDLTKDPTSPWFVTSGLLAEELVTGRMQVGNYEFEQLEPAQVNVAGDLNDPNGPTYASFNPLMGYGAIPSGWKITQTVDRAGTVGNDSSLASYNVTAQDVGVPTNHNVASVFWDFMTATAQSGNAFYETGYPLTEAYWTHVLVGGVSKLVLVQVFERRVLTYTPSNPDGWQVEAGNVGLQYYQWRYGSGLNSSAPTDKANIDVGTFPIGVAVNPTTNRVYVVNFSDSSVSVINGATNTVTTTVHVGGHPEGITVNPITGMVYVANQYDSSISVINGATNTVTTTVHVGGHPAVAVNSNTDTVYTANLDDNTVSVINGATNTVTATIPVGSSPLGVAVNPSTDTVYVVNNSDNTVSVIDGAINSVTATIPVGSGPFSVVVNPSTNTVYATNFGDNTVSVINGANNTVTATITVGTWPTGLAVNPNTDTVYTANLDDNTVSVINGATNTVTTTVPVGSNPAGVAVNPSTGTVYVTSEYDNTVSVINP